MGMPLDQAAATPGVEAVPRVQTGGSTFRSDLRKLWPMIADRKAAFAALVALGLTASLLDAVAVSLVSALLYLSMGGAGQPRQLAMLQRLLHIDVAAVLQGNLWRMGFLIVLVVMLRAGAVALYGIGAAAIKGLVFHRLRVRIYRRYMFAPFEEQSKASFGFLTNTLQVEAPRVAELIDQLFRMPISGCAAGVLFLAIILLSWPVALLVVVAGLILSVVMQFSRFHLHRLGYRTIVLHEELAGRMMAGIQALRTIQAFAAEGREFDRFVPTSRSVARMLPRFSTVEGVINLTGTLVGLGILALVILASNGLGNSAATTLTVLALLYRMQPQVQALQGSLTAIHGLESSLSLVMRVIEDHSARPASKPAGLTAVVPRTAIRFRDVSYRHPATAELTLTQLDCEIPCGLVTALVGDSGAGKTTLLNLLLRLTEPTTGVIEVDGVPLSSIDRLSWLRRVAVAGQDIDLLSGTILDNLRLGRPELSPADAMAALDLAGIADFVGGLPAGLETLVGERGHRLSGGQRQRIGLARALVMQPWLLILDEATNAVDSGLETEVYRRVRAAYPDMTILIVAHRSSALAETDHRIVIAGGRVIEAGQPTRAATG